MILDQKTKFIGAIAVQLIAIFSIILFKLLILGGGTEVLLHVVPVDPRDYLRGDHVTFQYDISSLRAYNFDYYPILNGDIVYVSLARSGQYWSVSGLSGSQRAVTRVKPKDGIVFIKGTVKSGGSSGKNSWDNDNIINVEYGIEQYYIPVDAGTNFNFRSHNVFSAVQVGENGDSVLKKLYVDGKEWPGKN